MLTIYLCILHHVLINGRVLDVQCTFLYVRCTFTVGYSIFWTVCMDGRVFNILKIKHATKNLITDITYTATHSFQRTYHKSLCCHVIPRDMIQLDILYCLTTTCKHPALFTKFKRNFTVELGMCENACIGHVVEDSAFAIRNVRHFTYAAISLKILRQIRLYMFTPSSYWKGSLQWNSKKQLWNFVSVNL